jgi:hypothetical protein
MLLGTAPHHVEQMDARLERTHHTRCGLMEHTIGDMIEHMVLELKVDDEVNMRRVVHCRERPRVCQMFQRPFDGAHE